GKAKPWPELDLGEQVEIDVDHLVENLRDLSRVLSEDAAAQADELATYLGLHPGREQAMLGELEALAQDLSPGVTGSSLPGEVAGYVGAVLGLAARVWRQYLLRVAQLALARIMLYRSWEDVEFVGERLYDGGFNAIYERLDRNLRDVLSSAFAEGLQKYPWLYGHDNNYDWYRPRDEALAEVLYGLIPFPLGRLDADVLGGLYESYVDEIDRDRLGQFFTPRSVVRFMLERAGFDGPEAVFDLAGDERRPMQVLDFATGSGGFVVEAARRIIDRGGLDLTNADDLADGLKAIVRGIHGCEISPFPYYLTEINLLLQVSRLLGAMTLAGVAPQAGFALGVVHADTLTTRPGDAALSGLSASESKEVAELSQDAHYALVPLDAEKQAAFERVRQDESFDLVVGNPPYVFESNNRLLFERLRQIPAWKGTYRGKSDYLYYFLQLAVEKLKPGGRLCVITPAGWMNAGNAAWLRETIASKLQLDELFLFGGYRLFAPERAVRGRRLRAPTPTVESAILVATKGAAPKGHKLKIVALEDEVAAAIELAPDPAATTPDRTLLLEEMARRAGARGGRKHGIHVHSVEQAKLVHDRPWPIKHSARDVPTRVVAHLDRELGRGGSDVERLAERWSILQGIQTGADAYTPRIQQRLETQFADAKHELDQRGAVLGSPIMELPAGGELVEPWASHPNVLARSIEPDAILYGAMDETRYTSLVWLGREDVGPAAVVNALEPWKPVLRNRADFLDNPE
ncbi:MAG: SAM-dependent methyltransferase, partial [Actinomycetota bacterium]|nr:SAM-dependent methyltransferase [Actinomycetota bacterium]